MLTLNDIRRSFEEQDWPYEDQESHIIVKTTTTGEEEVPVLVAITCDAQLFDILCFTANPINVPCNGKVNSVINSLDQHYNFFQFYAEETGNKCRLGIHYCVLGEYLSDPKIAGEMLVRSIRVMDDFYVQVMKARWAE